MASNKEIEAGAKAIADDMALPDGGRKKLARLISDHLDWFDAVAARGLTVGDISRVLFAAGATAANGRPIPLGTLSSAVWRKRGEAAMPAKPVLSPAKVRLAKPAPRQDRSRKRDAASSKPAALTPDGKTSMNAQTQRPSSKKTAMKPLSAASLNSAATSKAQTLAFMKRAAAIRRGKTD